MVKKYCKTFNFPLQYKNAWRNRQFEAAEKMHKKNEKTDPGKRIRRAVLEVGVMILLLLGCTRKAEINMDGLHEESFLETEQERQIEEKTEASSAIYVYVCGAVQTPGVYELQDGMRVYEALAAAGGFREDADTGWLNQAALVQDGQRLYVYTQEETQTLSADASQMEVDGLVSGSTANGKVDLNTASKETLMTLPGIGEARAEAILAYRSEHGRFASIEEIQNISGIKSALFEKIREKIMVS